MLYDFKRELIELVEMAGQQAYAVLVGLQKPLMPRWLYINGEGEANIIGTPWTDEAEKKRMVRELRLQMLLDKATAYSLVVEAWPPRLRLDVSSFSPSSAMATPHGPITTTPRAN
jgi:hypothetical protein